MLAAVLGKLHNWFDRDANGRFLHVESGELSVEGGSLVGADGWLQDGQYFRILGSVFNDGLHQHPACDLKDESFEGCAYALAVPTEVVDLAQRIGEWEAKNGDAARGPYQSESFGGYSYSLKDGGGGSSPASGGWERAFAPELRRWRKL